MAIGTITDRRKNPSGKNLPNRQRFLNKSKKQIVKSIKEKILKRSVTDGGDESVSVPVDGIHEPQFAHDRDTGNTDIVVPGNADFSPGDVIKKPKGGGQAAGKDASENGEGEDDFEFLISASEYHDLLFEDLDLPNLKKRSLNQIVHTESKRAGHVSEGTPNNLDLLKSMKNSYTRRIALRNPKLRKIKELEEELAAINSNGELTEEDNKRIVEINEEIHLLRVRANAVGFIDPIDLKYRNYTKVPKPNYQAVIFCVMDVSGSMGQTEKELAKRFYMLLYLFLQQKYKTVDIVFIRHHSTAKECTEEEFFNLRETGGTVVSTGFELMTSIQKERYPESDWNVYVAQASDGDNFNSDNVKLLDIINDEILPIAQYFAYVEVGNPYSAFDFMTGAFYGVYGEHSSETSLWKAYKAIDNDIFNMKKIRTPSEIFPVFRELFAKEKGEK
jgi:uncharacterized sporulation protein YeaH/YhbH (DUF444 family)